ISILLGGCFRFYNLDWDLKHSFHPDERNILGQTSGVQPGDGYRVKFFAYGQLPVYLYRATGDLVSTPAFIWNLFRGHEDMAQGFYWFLLLILAGAAVWFFSQEEFKEPAFGASVFMFSCLIFFKFFSIFSIWFGQLEERPLKSASFAFVAIVSIGLAALISELFEIEWAGMPLYSASGATFLLGILPIFLPVPWARTFSTLAFTLLVLGLAVWWAWVSRWGRVVLSLLTLWAFFASQTHGGHQYTGYGECMILGRWWSALFSTLTIGAIYLFVQRAYKKTDMALLAAASFAFAVVSIEQAHYCITESFITLMFVVVALCATEIIRDGSWKSYLMAGAAFGLAMAAKTSSLYYVLILVTAHLVFLGKKPAKEWEKADKRQSDNREL
ncbi:MAG TPA: glycosyltransferase family 39 protein, partial [bacterium]